MTISTLKGNLINYYNGTVCKFWSVAAFIIGGKKKTFGIF